MISRLEPYNYRAKLATVRSWLYCPRTTPVFNSVAESIKQIDVASRIFKLGSLL
jgi:hypothetical protein